MLYQEYKNKMAKLVRILDFIRRYKALIISVVATIFVLIVSFLATKGILLKSSLASDTIIYGEKIEFVPENPTREGYTFGGWYKEESCENKWDFNNDRLPEIKKGAQGETLYQETKLYAKWIKN